MENESTSNQGSGSNQGGASSQGTSQSTTTQQVLPQRNPQIVTKTNPPGNLQKND